MIDVAAVHEALVRGGATVSCAESLTGGRLAAALTSVGGASRCVLGGVVAYAATAKRDLLGVPADLLETHGTISAECAEAMAREAARIFNATYALSTTGVAGPAEEEGKPVGTVFVALAGPGQLRVAPLHLRGDRAAIADAAVQAALALLADALGVGRAGEEPRLR